MAEDTSFTDEHAPRQPRRLKRDDPEAAAIEGDWPPPEQKAAVEAREEEQKQASDVSRARGRRRKSE